MSLYMIDHRYKASLPHPSESIQHMKVVGNTKSSNITALATVTVCQNFT